jgi:hypothetical protein
MGSPSSLTIPRLRPGQFHAIPWRRARSRPTPSPAAAAPLDGIPRSRPPLLLRRADSLSVSVLQPLSCPFIAITRRRARVPENVCSAASPSAAKKMHVSPLPGRTSSKVEWAMQRVTLLRPPNGRAWLSVGFLTIIALRRAFPPAEPDRRRHCSESACPGPPLRWPLDLHRLQRA